MGTIFAQFEAHQLSSVVNKLKLHVWLMAHGGPKLVAFGSLAICISLNVNSSSWQTHSSLSSLAIEKEENKTEK